MKGVLPNENDRACTQFQINIHGSALSLYLMADTKSLYIHESLRFTGYKSGLACTRLIFSYFRLLFFLEQQKGDRTGKESALHF